MKKLLLFFLSVVVLFGVLSGCNSSEQASSEERGLPSTASESEESSTVEEATPEDAIEYITDDGEENDTVPDHSALDAESDVSDGTEPAAVSEEENTSEDKTAAENTANREHDPAEITDGSSFSVLFIDVSEADAALVACDGHYMLIDGGNPSDSSLIYSLLKQTGVEKLDIIVGTHPHEDHIGGLPGALNYASADLTLCPTAADDSEAFADLKKYADRNGNGITVPSAGDKYMLGSATVSILGANSTEETNNTSIVLKIEYGDTSFLFTGDAERGAEEAILDSGCDLSADVLKVGHHGSETSTSDAFLQAVMPRYAVISVGEGNPYGHPTYDVLSKLRDADVEVFRTDLNGDVRIESDGKNLVVSTKKDAGREEIFAPASVVISEIEMPDDSALPVEKTQPGTVETEQTVERDYIVNSNTGKFHYPTCKSVKQMKEKNKVNYTGDRNDLISQGYSPCGNCHP